MSIPADVRRTNIETFDQYYNKPAWWFRWRYDTQIKKKTCLALLKKLNIDWSNKRIFEIGFGSGDILFSFPRSCELFGVELSASAVEQARTRAAKKGYTRYAFSLLDNSSSLSLPDHTVDLVIASHVLEHVPDEHETLREVSRVLKVGGVFVVLIPINERFADPHHVRKFSFESCKSLCEQQGFSFLFGFQNELIFYMVEKFYWNRTKKVWGIGANAIRVLFNLLTAPLPFWIYRLLDGILEKVTGLPPRQAGLIFRRS